ncbi:hypothetical protein SAMN00777080_0728 [Aquiflexum balticum DSM 16537]|uniref:Uncharacterized protein n=1 Tax=Aquiflexum balticum DSM 16537 TaxID=758820 RepID=A0A1W2H0M7_9BACT|nr:hypothetical protein [Aquiflexum balticum]SMD42188.1 hypothetical protein SAMN00777080_0728 [Aquiflexum balticum DSM 16537]
MSTKKIIGSLEDYFQDGIVSDTMLAIHHYVIQRTIGENYIALKNAPNKNLNKLFGQLQASSSDLAIIHLSKVFDKKNKHHLVRSIEELLDYNFQITSYFPLVTNDYIEFSLIKSKLGIEYLPIKFDNPNELAKFFKDIFNSLSIKRKSDDVKFIRNKFLAHNEHEVEFNHLNNFWEDFLYLIDFLKIFISLFGVTILSASYFQFQDFKQGSLHYSIISDLYWLVEEIQKEIGEENFKFWWNE